MIKGFELNELAQTIVRHASGKEDFIAPSSALRFGVNPANQITVSLPNDRAFDLTTLAENQVGDFLGIPRRFAQRLSTEMPDLLAHNLNTLGGRTDSRRMLRTLDGVGRSFLSDSYKRVDNEEVFDGIFPSLMRLGAEVESCNVSDDYLHLQAVIHRMEGEIRVGDPVRYGVVISNSEVGRGSLSIRPILYRLRCLNGMVVADQARRRAHIGGSYLENADLGWLALTSETQKLKVKAMVAELGEYLESLATPERFEKTLGAYREVADQPLPADPTPVVESLAARYSLNKSESESALVALCESKDYTRWGLANAVTWIANDASSYDRAVELEAVGGTLMGLSQTAFKALAVMPRASEIEMANA
jgi:hypothetical protein